ncbi:MAG: hypothetical protein H6811_11565 [Phycisphaeraceae bacterium]|nr:hypothetical protein [Phycisphaeraceae bacterium]
MTEPPQSPTVRGTCHVLLALDVGFSIDLSGAQARLSGADRPRMVRLRRPSPSWFEFEPPPLHLVQDIAPLPAADRETLPRVELTLLDFGAVGVAYRIPFEGPLDSLVELSRDLMDAPSLVADARARVESLVTLLGNAVTRPRVSELIEDYFVFSVREWDAGTGSLSSLITSQAPILARILQGETGELSAALIDDVQRGSLSYAPGDAAVFDWNGAIVFDPEPDDVLAILQHANIELLEMRLLDSQLDTLLDRSHELIARQARQRVWALITGDREMRRFAQFQADSAVMFEGVTNAIKLVGNQYLARLYRLAADRLALRAWDASVKRKLEAAQSVYQKLADFAAARRSELLEIIIILLILFEIVMPMFPGTPWSH